MRVRLINLRYFYTQEFAKYLIPSYIKDWNIAAAMLFELRHCTIIEGDKTSYIKHPMKQ